MRNLSAWFRASAMGNMLRATLCREVRSKAGWTASAVLLASAAHAQLTMSPAGQQLPSPQQMSSQGQMAHPDGTAGSGAIVRSPEIVILAQRQAQLRNAERQKKLVDDSRKLLVLARDLKISVANTPNGKPSLDAARTADEIQRLAKSVQDKMRSD